MKKPPYIKLYIKDFVFDIVCMSDDEKLRYIDTFIEAYRSGEIPKEYENKTLLVQLSEAFSDYKKTCERNKQNRLKSNTYQNQSLTTLVNQNQNHKPEPELEPYIDYNDDFEEFWKAYETFEMGKGSKKTAKEKYIKIRKGNVDHETIIGKCREYSQFCKATKCKTKHAVTWLNQNGWEDEYSINDNSSPRTYADTRTKDDKLRDRVNATAGFIDNLLGETGC